MSRHGGCLATQGGTLENLTNNKPCTERRPSYIVTQCGAAEWYGKGELIHLFWRTTSSHLHVVSAGNSQRNNSAVSECQEELKTTRLSPPFATRRRAENRPPSLTKQHNITAPVR
ncbi:hypothetical protein K469DRAFT_323144 [Zopfia rhizophila CBS 207.26]|uniref:Uncharacterized protein n=1 Tax=Zopfia rhizophila CBS 207.26 TaxID=1314779 RepID=A0A6A6DNE6_9PEZI|nr:hypothetical protein K469DRAFT_323144 [Zopfia rhizophila CBS 207.26]